MTPQLMYQIAQDAIKLYRLGYRLGGTNQFFENRAVATLTKNGIVVSECFEKAAALWAIEGYFEEQQMKKGVKKAFGDSPRGIENADFIAESRNLAPKIAEAFLIALQTLKAWSPLIANHDDVCDAFERIEKKFAEDK